MVLWGVPRHANCPGGTSPCLMGLVVLDDQLRGIVQRPLFDSVTIATHQDRVDVAVAIEDRGRTCRGQADMPAGRAAPARAAACAALHALRDARPATDLRLASLSVHHEGPYRWVTVILSRDSPGDPAHVIGSALADGDLPAAAVRAVLKACNRGLKQASPGASLGSFEEQVAAVRTSTAGGSASGVWDSATLVKGYLDLMLAHLDVLDTDRQRQLLQGAVRGTQRLIANLQMVDLGRRPPWR